MNSLGYIQTRKTKRIWIDEWKQLSLTVQGGYCKRYNVILTKNKISRLNSFLVKFDPGQFKLKDVPKYIATINKYVEMIGNGTQKFNDAVGKIGDSVGQIGIQDSKTKKVKDPLKNFNLDF